MAEGKPVGTMYVELAMDATKYTKAQKEILAGAEKNSADINKAFKIVGTKSDEMYNAMRQNITNHLEAIKRSHLSSNDEIRRAKESAAAKLKQIDTEQFGHHDTLLEGLKKNWIAAAAVIGTAMIAIRKSWQMIQEGAQFEETRGRLENLAEASGTTAEKIVKDMKLASEGMVSNADLMSVALEGLAKGLSADDLNSITEAATILSDIVGGTVTQTIKDLTAALETGRVKGILNYAGAEIKLSEAFGDLESKMSTAEKRQGMLNSIIMKAAELQATQKKAIDGTADSVERLDADFKNMTTTIEVDLMRAMVKLDKFLGKLLEVTGVNAALKAAGGVLSDTANYWLGTNKATPEEKLGAAWIAYEAQEKAKKAAADQAKLKTDVKTRADAEAAAKKTATGGGGSTDNSASEIAKDTYEKEIANAEYAAKMQVTAGKDALTAKLEALDKQEAALKTYYEEEKSLAAGSKEKLSTLELTYTEDSNKYAYERAKIIREQELNTLELKKTSAEAQAEIDKKELDLAKELYDAKAKYGGTSNLDDLKAEYEVKRKSLEIDNQKLEAELLYAQAKGDSNAKEKEILEILKKQKLIKAEIYNLTTKEAVASLEYTGNFFEGWSSGIAKWSKDAKSEFQNAQDMAKTTADAMKTALSDGFYKLIKGESISITDIFSTMFDTILKKWTDTMAEMVLKWVTSKEAMELAGTAISTGASAIGSILGGLFHEGGIVGESYGASRLMPAYAFAGAPRLHNGLAADEYPAILQKGEEVIPKSKVGQQSEKSSEGAQVTQNTITINAIDSKSFADICKRNPSALMGPVMSSMKSNKTRNDMRKLLK